MARFARECDGLGVLLLWESLGSCVWAAENVWVGVEVRSGWEDRWVGKGLCGREEGRGFHGEMNRLPAGGENGKNEKKKKSKIPLYAF